jgi:hypothetical protein
MKRFIMGFCLVFVFAAVSFAADMPRAKGQNLEKHKAEIINRIDARIARNQEEKTCVQAAKTFADVKVCQDKFKERR